MTFPRVIADTNAPDNRMRIGIVASLFPLQVNVQGTLIPVGRAASFSPVVGETVAIMRQDGTWMIMDQTVAPTDETLRFQAGSVDVTVTAASSIVVPVVFRVQWPSTPAVSTNINSGSGSVAGWQSRAISVTATGFNLFLFGTANTFTVAVQWQAQEMTQ